MLRAPLQQVRDGRHDPALVSRNAREDVGVGCTVAPGDEAHLGPGAVVVDHERAAAVAAAGVLHLACNIISSTDLLVGVEIKVCLEDVAPRCRAFLPVLAHGHGGVAELGVVNLALLIGGAPAHDHLLTSFLELLHAIGELDGRDELCGNTLVQHEHRSVPVHGELVESFVLPPVDDGPPYASVCGKVGDAQAHVNISVPFVLLVEAVRGCEHHAVRD
mmetsp:Transcript_78748/g.222625  ORF Transcript_78748/g.222625 Transcript_78748/m.222625 type:complete len:218 (-) Transcript_78748:388-1041(-)